MRAVPISSFYRFASIEVSAEIRIDRFRLQRFAECRVTPGASVRVIAQPITFRPYLRRQLSVVLRLRQIALEQLAEGDSPDRYSRSRNENGDLRKMAITLGRLIQRRRLPDGGPSGRTT